MKLSGMSARKSSKKKKSVAGEVEEEVERETDQEGDSRFSEFAEELACPGHQAGFLCIGGCFSSEPELSREGWP
jgi:hypothetical protein